MKLGIDAKRAFYNFRGLGNYTRTLIEGLVNYYPQIQLNLYTPRPYDIRGISWIEQLQASVKGQRTHSRPGTQVQIRTPKTFLGQNFPSLWRSFSLSTELEKDRIDLYHGTSQELPFMTSSSRSFKTIVTVHDLLPYRKPEFFPFVDRQIYSLKLKKSCHNADAVLAICQQTKNDLIEILHVPEEKIQVIYQACHPRFYHLVEAQERLAVTAPYGISGKYILYVGALEERKNILNLLKAFSRIHKEISHKLVLIGGGSTEYLKEIDLFIRQESLTSRVKILDSIQSDQLPAFYQGADVFFYPSFFEGFGIPIVEALYSGVPVITSHGSSFPESAGPMSVFVTPEDVEEMAFQLKRVVEDQDLRQKMSQSGRDYVKRFHWQNTSENLLQFYNKVLGQ